MTRREKTQLLPLVEASRMAGVPYRSAWQAVVDGRIAAKRTGARWEVRVRDLQVLKERTN